MKVKIGKHKQWIGPYQITGLLKYLGFSADYCHKLGGKSPEWLQNLCEWIETKRNRKVKIKIDYYDTFNMDHTLALIILPMLIQLKENNCGHFIVENKDVPEELHTVGDDFSSEGECTFKKYNWVMDEMIWSFSQVLDSDGDSEFFHYPDDYDFEKDLFSPENKMTIDKEGLKGYNERISNGLKLFGIYYRGLWD